MASNSGLRESSSGRALVFDLKRATNAVPEIWAGFVTILVAGPWLADGYIFGTDWPGPRHFDLPSDLSSSAPAEAALAAVSKVISGEWTGKVFVVGLLFVAALTAYRAVPTNGFVPRAIASTVFVVNPFVFGRLHYGQMFVLAGYALLPWIATRTRQLILRPGVKAGLLLALSFAAAGAVSTHMILIAGVLIAAVFISHLLLEPRRLEFVRSVGPSVLLAAVVTLIGISYLAVPFVLGRGPIANLVTGVNTAQLSVYAAVPDDKLGLLPNLRSGAAAGRLRCRGCRVPQVSP